MATSVTATILVIDDCKEVLDRTSAYLQHQGYRVFCLQDAFNASAMMREQAVSLVVLDIRMPLGGDTVASLLERFHATPLVYYSAVDDATGEALAKKRHNTTFVSKGVGLRALAREIEKRLLMNVVAAPKPESD